LSRWCVLAQISSADSRASVNWKSPRKTYKRMVRDPTALPRHTVVTAGRHTSRCSMNGADKDRFAA
jgi:hypothetical protein